jgi:hypothetical protein
LALRTISRIKNERARNRVARTEFKRVRSEQFLGDLKQILGGRIKDSSPAPASTTLGRQVEILRIQNA